MSPEFRRPLVDGLLRFVEPAFGHQEQRVHPAAMPHLSIGGVVVGSRAFDLVVGADGLHSRVRELVFGPENQFERYLGIKVAAFEAEGYRPRDELVYVMYSRAGQEVSRFSMRG